MCWSRLSSTRIETYTHIRMFNHPETCYTFVYVSMKSSGSCSSVDSQTVMHLLSYVHIYHVSVWTWCLLKAVFRDGMLVYKLVHHFSLDWKFLTTTGWIAMTFFYAHSWSPEDDSKRLLWSPDFSFVHYFLVHDSTPEVCHNTREHAKKRDVRDIL